MRLALDFNSHTKWVHYGMEITMEIINKLKIKLENARSNSEGQLPEISEEMVKRLETNVAGAGVWCRANWAQGCDA